ncbi:MAG: hypothetical protein QM659_11300, partial [Rhodomicrobium sp.]
MRTKRLLVPAVAALGLSAFGLATAAGAAPSPLGASSDNLTASGAQSSVTLVRDGGRGGFGGAGFRGGGFRGASPIGSRFSYRGGGGFQRASFGPGFNRGFNRGYARPIGFRGGYYGGG